MKKVGFIMLLLVLILVSMPVVADSIELFNGGAFEYETTISETKIIDQEVAGKITDLYMTDAVLAPPEQVCFYGANNLSFDSVDIIDGGVTEPIIKGGESAIAGSIQSRFSFKSLTSIQGI